MPMTTRLRSGAGRRVNYRALAGMKKRMIRRARRAPNTVRVRSTLGFPDRMITKLEYRTAGIYNFAGSTIRYDYNLNSIFDPEVALGGHQPLWTDQYQAIYNKYRVFKCLYKITITALSTGGTPARYVALSSAQPTSALPATIGDAWEQNRTGNKVLPSGPDKLTVVKGVIYLPRLQGQTPTEFKGDDGNSAPLIANPTNPAILRTMLESVNGNPTEYSFDIQLTYFVEFFDRVTPHIS